MNAIAHTDELALEALRPGPVQPLTQVPNRIAQDGSPAGIMLAMAQYGVSAADLRELLSMQREWRADEARNAFNAALAAFKSEPVYVRKTKAVGYETQKGDFVGYKHAELSDVVAAVGPALAKHGLSHRWDVTQTKDWISVKCILKHAAGHSESVEMGGPPDNSGKKNAIQQIASTVSYLQRYTLKAITGVAEENDDDDGQGGDGNSDAAAYPEESFRANLSAWSELILSGRKSADQIIASVESRGAPMTDQQKADLKAVAN